MTSTSDHSVLLLSLLDLSREIASSKPPKPVFHRRHVSSLLRRSQLLSVLFEELLRSDIVSPLSPPAILCLAEILTVLRRSKALLHACSPTRSSRMRLALLFSTVSEEFRQLAHDVSTLLDILPLDDVDLGDDVRDLVLFLRAQCWRFDPSAPDPTEEMLRCEILAMVKEIERELVPTRSRLEDLFDRLGLNDATSCKEEISRLEIEIHEGNGLEPMLIALLGLVRYAKCVLFGASTPRSYSSSAIRSFSFPDIPEDFRCPISLDLMSDPVVVASGQTYDRESIEHWIQCGHATCPKTGRTLPNLRLIPNKALKNLIAQWCRERNVPFESEPAASSGAGCKGCGGMRSNKAAMEAARMTALFLVRKLMLPSSSAEDSNRIVYELRQLSKAGPENRAFIAEAGAIPLLLPLLGSDNPSLQVNAVTALLNLSILEDNKKRIMKASGGLESVVSVLRTGANWHAKENAAATLLSLSSLHSVYRKRIGREAGVAEGLAELVSSGPTSSKRDGLITILNLAGVRENIGRLVDGGVIPAVLEAAATADVAEMAVAVLAAVAKRGGAEALGKTEGFVEKLVAVMRHGNDPTRESAAAALVSVCRNGGIAPVEELSTIPGIEWVIWGMMGSGSARARRKAAALGRICRRWAASQEIDRTAGLNSLAILTPAES